MRDDGVIESLKPLGGNQCAGGMSPYVQGRKKGHLPPFCSQTAQVTVVKNLPL